jgi:predicted nucleotidyltransferase
MHRLWPMQELIPKDVHHKSVQALRYASDAWPPGTRSMSKPQERRDMDDQVSAIIVELRRQFELLYGERSVRMILFGSQARGDAEPESDIDVLVVLRGPVDPGEEIARTGEVTAWLSLKYEVVISRVFVSAEQFSEEQSPLLLNVRREGLSV